MSKSTLTERGQISVPAALRKAMKLRSGQSFKWVRISDREFRVVVEAGKPPGPLSVLGYARKKRPLRRTGSWMQELRAGEKTP
ncbi:MAG TPA: sporulation regulator [Lacunisphaera sp.]|jgi:bifunctional DNA-binding transcriptional regulator/antitoxin component of YhaV-PrlF toxin-antitoxin module|nr:sporulation regulator [Lacunisphaera sp.]HQY04985.1 sporulation regulator [Lacunisphaera sp.]